MIARGQPPLPGRPTAGSLPPLQAERNPAYPASVALGGGEPADQAISIARLETLAERRGADVLVEVLRSEGVRYVFGNPGTTELPLIDALTDAADIAIIDEAPATLGHLRTLLHSTWTRQYSSIRGGVLGWGMPASVGFSPGLDRAPVVCLVGDGAAMYSPQALWTAAHEGLPVTFVVINNAEYNILKNFMKGQAHYASVRANRFIAMDLTEPRIDFPALAASMGVPARRIERAGDIAPAIEAGIASGGPNLVEIVVAAT